MVCNRDQNRMKQSMSFIRADQGIKLISKSTNQGLVRLAEDH